MDASSRPELSDFHGVSMTHYFTDNWENVQNFQARPDDILLVSYPKAGSTWVAYILDLLYFGQTIPESETPILLNRRVLHLEIAIPSLLLGLGPYTLRTPHMIRGTELLDNCSTSPRLIKTHLPVQFLPKSFWEQNCKIIYVGRNAKDSVVSYFHFQGMNKIFPEPGEWSSYLQRFMEGKMVFGSWYDHVSGWWEKKQSHPKLHFMFYEDLIEDTGREIDKLCCFLGLSPSSKEKERITGRVQFDEMKENNMVNYSLFKLLDFKKSPFMRKGKVGDWKNHFTVAQDEKFDEDYKQKTKNPSLLSQHYGNTWVAYILDLLYFGQTIPESETPILLNRRVLHLEITIPSLLLGLGPYTLRTPHMIRGTELLDNCSTSPRLIKTHLPVQFLPKSFWEQNCKIIYVGHNAKDSVVSYFHFQGMNKIFPEPGEWSSYPQRFMEGKMVFGSWYDHVSGWWEKKQSHPKLHFMFYEDLIEDTGREIDKLCCFLGLSPSSEEKERITGRVQFDEMKENNMVNQSLFKLLDFKKSSFMRKGKVGDWKNHFTVAQDEKFDEDYKQKMKNPSLQFRTEV